MKKIDLNIKNEMDMNNSNIPNINNHASQLKAKQNKAPEFEINYKDKKFIFAFEKEFEGFRLKSDEDYHYVMNNFSDNELKEFRLLLMEKMNSL